MLDLAEVGKRRILNVFELETHTHAKNKKENYYYETGKRGMHENRREIRHSLDLLQGS